MKFPTAYSEKKPVYTEPGERYRIEYQLAIDDETGEEYLEPIGQVDMFMEIQSHKESCDLEMVLRRLQNGDEDALERVKGFYADVSNMPVRMAEILNMNLRGQQVFEQLSPEYKEVYGNDYKNFVMEPERVFKYIDEKKAKAKTKAAEEVKANDDTQQ